MAELIVMCPECGLNAKMAPGALKIRDDEKECLHRHILNAMRRIASPNEQLGD